MIDLSCRGGFLRISPSSFLMPSSCRLHAPHGQAQNHIRHMNTANKAGYSGRSVKRFDRHSQNPSGMGKISLQEAEMTCRWDDSLECRWHGKLVTNKAEHPSAAGGGDFTGEFQVEAPV